MLVRSLLVFLGIFFFVSCQKKDDDEETVEVFQENVFTDSFSPQDWEIPVSRRVASSGDKDIGFFIRTDSIDPKNRNILNLTEKFFSTFSKSETVDVNTMLTNSAYNSYQLRLSGLKIRKEFSLRVEQPTDTSQNYFWLKVKVSFIDHSVIGSIQFFSESDVILISDFEEKFFNDLKEYADKKR